MNHELVLLPSLRAHRGPNGGLVLTQKFLNGVAKYAKTWPGQVTALVEISPTPTSDMDHVEVMPEAGKEFILALLRLAHLVLALARAQGAAHHADQRRDAHRPLQHGNVRRQVHHVDNAPGVGALPGQYQ